MNKPLLDYGVTSIPTPLQTQEPGQVSIAVSYSGDETFEVSQLLFSVEIGGSGDSLTKEATGLRALAGNGWRIASLGGGSFRATPISGASQPVTGLSVEFIVSGFTVNDDPGTTHVSVFETTIVDKVKRQGSDEYPLIKTAGPLMLTGPTANLKSVDYGGESLISWSATHGATITLDLDGTTIDHVKGQPGTPLPVEGSYSIDAIERADTVVTCTATLNSGTGPQTKSGQVTISMNAPVIETLTVSRVNGLWWDVEAMWAAKGAATTTLTIGQNAPVKVPSNGGLQQASSLSTSDVTLTVTNPVTTVTKTVSQAPIPTNWVRVADGPSLPADCRPMLFQAGDEIGLWAESTLTPSKLYLSGDAKNWRLAEGTPEITPSGFISPLVSTPTTTFFPSWEKVPTSGPDGPTHGFFLFRRDIATGSWSKSPLLSFTNTEINANCLLMTADPNGVLYAGCLFPGPGIFFSSNDAGETWVPLSTPDDPVHASFAVLYSTLAWFDDTLRLVGDEMSSSTLQFVAWDPVKQWQPGAITGSASFNLNVQSSVVVDTLYMVPNPSNTAGGVPLQLFKMSAAGAVVGFGPASGAVLKDAEVLQNNIGFTAFNDIFLVCGPPSVISGGGIWMFSQPDF